MIVVSTLVAHNVAMVGRPSGGSAGRFGCRQCGWLPGLFGPHSQVIARRCGKQIHADTNIAVTDFSGTGCFVTFRRHDGDARRIAEIALDIGGRLAKRADVPEGVRRTDTGARHKVANGFCTQIGNDRFTWFGTRPIAWQAHLYRLGFTELTTVCDWRWDLPPTGVAVFRRGAMEKLVAIVASQGLHVLHPEVIAEHTDLAHVLLEGELDLEAQTIETNDLDGVEGGVGAHQEARASCGMAPATKRTRRPAGRHSSRGPDTG